MWDGTFNEWDLATEVALIPEWVWAEGPEAIAARIKEIRKDMENAKTAVEPRAPEFEPTNVEQLFKHPRSVVASVSITSETILQGFEAFRRESGLNETPEFLEPLEAIPTYLGRIGEILRSEGRSDASEQALKEEIGRLSAKVAQLEGELAKLKDDFEMQQKPWFSKVSRLYVGVAALAGTIWMVSGDELGPHERLENLVAYWEFLFPEQKPFVDRVRRYDGTNGVDV